MTCRNENISDLLVVKRKMKIRKRKAHLETRRRREARGAGIWKKITQTTELNERKTAKKLTVATVCGARSSSTIRTIKARCNSARTNAGRGKLRAREV